MVLFVLFLLILKVQEIYNNESGCGCNSNRRHSMSRNEIFYKEFIYKDEQQCPLDFDNHIFEFEQSDKMVLIPTGIYQLGTDNMVIESDKEGPMKMVKIINFYLDKFEVSNKDFITFTKSTNYKTEAESFGDSFVFTSFLNSTYKKKMEDFRVAQAPWWYKISGADWSHPFGPDSDISKLMDHPVVHVSWNDARAYCAWRGGRLPTEAEWEAACRGGHRDTLYPWGNKLFPDRKYKANIWQGSFPDYNSLKDGFLGTNPVHLFPQNDYNLYNMAGNVWEWTEDSWSIDKPKEKVKKGGSYLCHQSYCYRYRCSARSHNTDDSSAGNLGFRCAKSA